MREKARGFIKLSGIYLVKNLLKVFWIFPINPKKIMFCSYLGRGYCCNPKYIYQYMRENKNYRYIWVINNPAHINPEIESCTIVHVKTMRFFYNILTSKVYINNGIAPSYIPFRKSQCVIGTWHGGGAYKKSGTDTEPSGITRKLFSMVAGNVSYVISACHDFGKIMEEAFLVPEFKLLPIGMPRNDIFFKTNHEKIIMIKNRLGIDADSKIVLYAPTFRSNLAGVEHDFHAGNYEIDYARLLAALKEKFEGNWVMLFRFHYYLEAGEKKDYVRDVSSYEDMQELLLVSDVLINDYSSSMWDFGLRRRPCFIYASDLEEYESTRGFYTPISRWPFPVAMTNDLLIRNILEFDESDYLKKLQGHYDSLGSYEEGCACKRVAELIQELE